MHAVVVVLGDVGHSPRMQNHAIELLKHGYTVDLVGYSDSELPLLLSNAKGLKMLSLAPFPHKRISLLNKIIPHFVANFMGICLKVLFLLWQLSITLSLKTRNHPDILIVQTPPSLPVMLVAPIYSFFSGAKYILDWHNLGYTILLQKYPNRILGMLAKNVEIILGRLAHFNLSVSRAEEGWLRKNGIKHVFTVYDRPIELNSVLLAEEEKIKSRNTLYKKIIGKSLTESDKFIITSTSWTADENFDLLIDALAQLEEDNKSLIDCFLHVFITGKGPLKDDYLAKIKGKGWKKIKVYALWLSFEEYKQLMAAADLGVSLHTSSSGLDLPMKVTDMMSVRIPILSAHYSTIEEILPLNCLFRDSNDLAIKISSLLTKNNSLWSQFGYEVTESWSDQWQRIIGLMLAKTVSIEEDQHHEL